MTGTTKPRHARDMSDKEFAAAMKPRAWRPPPAPPAPTLAPPKRATEMGDAEFAAAMKTRAWRR
jgi:hypothetical protein